MSLPSIKLIRTPIGYYFYDTNMNDLISINEDEAIYLQKVVNEHIEFDSIFTTFLNDCYNEGFLHPINIKKIEHSYTTYLPLFLSRKLHKITLQVTQDCNFRCKYCIYTENEKSTQRSHSNKTMSWEIAKKAVDYLWEHSVDSDHINVSFYGGEPLFEFNLIKRVVEYCENKFLGKELTFNITTNGTLLSEEIIKYFIKHNVRIMVSLDGSKEINDKNRIFADGSGTFNAVMDSLKRVREVDSDYAAKMMMSMVMDPENDFDCFNSVYVEFGDFLSHNISSTIVDKGYISGQISFSEDYTWKYEYQVFLAFLSYFRCYPNEQISPIASQVSTYIQNLNSSMNNIKPLSEIGAPGGPCIPGQLRLFCDVNGRLFPCERVSELSEAMNMGNIFHGIDIKKASKLLNVGSISPEQCLNCWCFSLCGVCAKKADIGEKSLSIEKKISACASERMSVYTKLTEILMLREVPQIYSDQIRGRL